MHTSIYIFNYLSLEERLVRLGRCLTHHMTNTVFISVFPQRLQKRFELNYDPVGPRDWMKANFWIPVTCAIIYAIAIFWGRSYFAQRPAWNWRVPLAWWNFGLSLFSTIGFLRVAPFVLFNVYSYTWRENCCFDPESHVGSGETGFWSQMFVLSKIP